MANTYFRFKQFTVNQDFCSMKVCTDACLFGAYLANWYNLQGNPGYRALDIGTGTGLLSLMLAQKTPLVIDAIEIDPGAAKQAKENFTAAPWSDRLNIIEQDARDHYFEQRYDLIFSNPPFFEADLRSPDEGKNIAKHDTGLTLEQLAVVAEKNLSPSGFFAILLPYHRIDAFIKNCLEHQLNLHQRLLVKHTEAHPFFRAILIFGRATQQPMETVMAIKDEGQYSFAFRELLRDFYLHL